MGGVPYPLLHRLGGFHWWRFYSLAGVNGLGVSLGEMSGNDIAMSGGEMWAVSPIPCFIGSVASIGGGSIPLQGDSVSSVGFYGCVGGVSLLQSLAGGQCFIGSVCVSMSVRYGGNMAMWFGVSLGGSVVFPVG